MWHWLNLPVGETQRTCVVCESQVEFPRSLARQTGLELERRNVLVSFEQVCVVVFPQIFSASMVLLFTAEHISEEESVQRGTRPTAWHVVLIQADEDVESVSEELASTR